MPAEVQALLPALRQLARGNRPPVSPGAWRVLLRFLEAQMSQGDAA